MNKKSAIEILESYLNLDRKVNPSSDTHLYLDRIKEHTFCWEIPHTSKEYFESQDFRLMPVGAGPYLIDKENGKIYLTGSAPIDWIKDFELMKSGQGSHSIWKEHKIHFLEVKFELLAKRNYHIRIETIHNDQLYVFLENEFRNFKKANKGELSHFIKRMKYNEFESTFRIGSPEGSVSNSDEKSELITLGEMPSISIQYSPEHYHAFVGPLNEIKDWLKINPEYQSTSNYWIELIEAYPDKPFKKWKLKMNLEIVRKQ